MLDREWKSGDQITLAMDMPVEVVAADERVKENAGKRALQRGPLVYCLEEVDNKDFNAMKLSDNVKFDTFTLDILLEGAVIIHAAESDCKVNFVPYYAWDNRKAGQMKVWVDYVQ